MNDWSSEVRTCLTPPPMRECPHCGATTWANIDRCVRCCRGLLLVPGAQKQQEAAPDWLDEFDSMIDRLRFKK